MKHWKVSILRMKFLVGPLHQILEIYVDFLGGVFLIMFEGRIACCRPRPCCQHWSVWGCPTRRADSWKVPVSFYSLCSLVVQPALWAACSRSPMRWHPEIVSFIV